MVSHVGTPSHSNKGGEFYYRSSDYQLFKKDPASYSYASSSPLRLLFTLLLLLLFSVIYSNDGRRLSVCRPKHKKISLWSWDERRVVAEKLFSATARSVTRGWPPHSAVRNKPFHSQRVDILRHACFIRERLLTSVPTCSNFTPCRQFSVQFVCSPFKICR